MRAFRSPEYCHNASWGVGYESGRDGFRDATASYQDNWREGLAQ